MIDVQFYMCIHELKKRFLGGIPPGERDDILAWLDSKRSRIPVVFNIETTNACNMTCAHCPRTTLMTRPVKTMDVKTFVNIVVQLRPQRQSLWDEWVGFAETNYNVPQDEQSENAFFLYILPRVIVLHGYGDPLLDPHIPDYVGMLTHEGIPSYFSCNPANIHLGKTANAFENGLSYIKYSIDSLSSSVRGRDAFKRDYPAIMRVLDMKAKHNYQTQIVITMIDLGRDEFESLKAAFAGTDVYIYQKSLDQAWMTRGDAPKSIHWSEFCQFPWSSMSINSSGQIIPCGEMYDPDVVLGDVNKESLINIWNGAEYAKLRRAHVFNTPGIRCTDGKCDMQVLGKFLI